MKKLEKYKIAPQAKFVKFKVKHFMEISTIRHDKAVPPMLDCQKLNQVWTNDLYQINFKDSKTGCSNVKIKFVQFICPCEKRNT